ncbi:MAG: hypothetical protein KGQ60_17290, partial [Planctomycetes bacterium]|nr:hypothetical protein [Planctomycetota bacterium]
MRRFGAVVLLLASVGCQPLFPARQSGDRPPILDLTPVVIEYADSEAFDNVLEAALVDQTPIITIRTPFTKPDWECRLNAWIAAWNQGGKNRTRTLRGQSGSGNVPLNADSLKELRLLVNDLFDRVESIAEKGSAWWTNERLRSRRVALLRPYSLRFHRDNDSPITVILFHGSYASSYPSFMRSIMKEPLMADEEWTRTVECS